MGEGAVQQHGSFALGIASAIGRNIQRFSYSPRLKEAFFSFYSILRLREHKFVKDVHRQHCF